MSETVCVKLYFGNRKIRYDEVGVDLGELNLAEKHCKRAAGRTWGP
jgi:hypothetical protein